MHILRLGVNSEAMSPSEAFAFYSESRESDSVNMLRLGPFSSLV